MVRIHREREQRPAGCLGSDTDTGLGPATSAGETATWSPGQPCAGVSQGGRDVSLSVDSVKVSVVLLSHVV